MKESFRLFMALLLISGLALSFSSCKDSENVSNDPNSPENIALSKESESAKALLNILSFTSELDSLPDNWASNSYTVEPTVGIVLDESTPYVRYIATNSKEGAINYYNSIAAKEISKDANSAKQNIDNAGSLSFNVLNQPDVTATLDINIKQQPHLTQIRFVPASALGTNDGGTPYYSFGDVVVLTEENGQKSYWICARPCSKTSKKYMSHWFSFQLNDLGTENSNFKEFENPHFILPTKLGNEDKAKRHIPNLIKLLAKLNIPGRYKIEQGLGELKQSEFDEDAQESVSYFWKKYKVYEKVLPITIKDFTEMLNWGTFGVFYNGYSYSPRINPWSNPSVWMTEVKVPEYHYESQSIDAITFKSGEVSWKKTTDNKIVDFRDYAKNGIISNSTHVSELPVQGLIVRYKSGNQMIGKSGNDKDMTKSFKDFSKNIEEFFVYKNAKAEDKSGKAVVGDFIVYGDENQNYQNGKGKLDETCALNSSDLTENYSLFFKYWDYYLSEDLELQPLNFAKYAYVNLMMDLCRYVNLDMDPNESEKFNNFWESNLTEIYKKGIQEMSDGIVDNSKDKLSSVQDLVALVNLKYDQSKEYFSLTFPYDKDGGFAEAELRYYWKSDKYSVITKHAEYDNSKAYLSLTSYRDTEGKIHLKENQNLVEAENITEEKRSASQEQTTRFLKSIKFE